MSERYGAGRFRVPGKSRDFSGIVAAGGPGTLASTPMKQGVSFGEHRFDVDWIEHDPDYDILRDDRRFKNLLARLK